MICMEFVNAKMAAYRGDCGSCLTNQWCGWNSGELNSVQKVYEIFSKWITIKILITCNLWIWKWQIGTSFFDCNDEGWKGFEKDDHYDWQRYSGISDYGTLKYAHRPMNWLKSLKRSLHRCLKEARKDLESGDYLFGRGLSTWKPEMQSSWRLWKKFKDIENFEGKLIFAAVCDEEEIPAECCR